MYSRDESVILQGLVAVLRLLPQRVCSSDVREEPPMHADVRVQLERQMVAIQTARPL